MSEIKIKLQLKIVKLSHAYVRENKDAMFRKNEVVMDLKYQMVDENNKPFTAPIEEVLVIDKYFGKTKAKKFAEAANNFCNDDLLALVMESLEGK